MLGIRQGALFPQPVKPVAFTLDRPTSCSFSKRIDDEEALTEK
jgi:hypothetical protein